ncbi:hypothetical protein [Ruegeria atlantica]|uniref:hypothetical protein n=1 Tax=Ruegeria atlantica TaxID=81569 RepID=UPI0014807445|nr:hypothetical protein [Ruegeria atlantica]
MPFDKLLTQIESLPELESPGEIIFRACEYELTRNQAFALAESVRRLADHVDELPSRRKPTYDRGIKRMLSRLPAEAAWPVAEPWLEHKRKFRRETAYAILRKTGVDEKAGARLLKIFLRTGDQAALELIARNPVATRDLEIGKTLPLFADEYWRMRMVEAVLIENSSKAVAFKFVYPREFTHAVGRQKKNFLLSELRSLFDLNAENLDYLSIYAWALGQLGALSELSELREHLESLSRSK